MKDSIRFVPTMIQWVGFNSTTKSVVHSSRTEGKSSYNLTKLFSLAFNIVIVNSDKPLKLIIKIGGGISLSSMLVATYFLIQWLRGEITVLGYTSLILSIWILSGIIIFMLGIIGLYVGKTFEETKGRPTYIIKEMLNDH